MMVLGKFYTFLREDSTRTKSTKSTKSAKGTKSTKSEFIPLRSFYAHKKYKTSNKQLLPLRRFYALKNDVFLVFICLCVFCAFLCYTSNFLPLRCFLCAFKAVFNFICLYVFCAFGACEIFL